MKHLVDEYKEQLRIISEEISEIDRLLNIIGQDEESFRAEYDKLKKSKETLSFAKSNLTYSIYLMEHRRSPGDYTGIENGLRAGEI